MPIHIYRLFSIFFLVFNSTFVSAQDTVKQLNKRFSYKPIQLVTPIILMSSSFIFSGGLKVKYTDIFHVNSIEHINENIDGVLAFTPIVAAYSLDICGVPSRTDFLNRSAIFFKAEILTIGGVYLLKGLVKERRPDGSNLNSFPSSHSAQAFMAATFLSVEYKDRFPWMPYASYTVASAVAALRIAHNKHYLNDVLFGAGFGILSQKVSYWTHQYKWGNHSERPIFKF